MSFEVRAGEVLGIAGVQGNGQTELVEALTGLRKSSDGRMFINGTDVTNASPRVISEHGVAHIPEDRHTYGMVTDYPIIDNLILNTYYEEPFSKGITMQNGAIEAHARGW